ARSPAASTPRQYRSAPMPASPELALWPLPKAPSALGGPGVRTPGSYISILNCRVMSVPQAGTTGARPRTNRPPGTANTTAPDLAPIPPNAFPGLTSSLRHRRNSSCPQNFWPAKTAGIPWPKPLNCPDDSVRDKSSTPAALICYRHLQTYDL